MKKALIVYGSPRKNGNTNMLLKKLLEGIKDSGHSIHVKKVFLRELCIFPCRECAHCEAAGTCCIEDDMQKIYPELEEADYVILSSPMFFYHVTAQTKALIDRAQALWVKKYILKRTKNTAKKRGGWFIAVGATRGDKLFEGSVLTMKYFFDALGIPYAGDLFVKGVDRKGDVLDHPEALSQAYQLGREIGLRAGSDV